MSFIKKVISLLTAVTVFFGTLTAASVSADNVRTADRITFGSYPQSRVSDETLISRLDGTDCEWRSFGYYTGTGKWNDGKMKPSDFMRYTDVTYDGCRYRGVVFDSFRPYFTGMQSSRDGETYQDDNGYCCGTVYWFKYEPLVWRVTDPGAGYILCESIIDSQPFQNMIYYNGSEYFADGNFYDYSNYYVVSSVRRLLNNDFYNCAFSAAEKANIKENYMDDLWTDISDKVFLPSANEMKSKNFRTDDADGIASGTDYAKCQGLFEDGGSSYWYLRSPGDNSYTACCVSTDGSLYSYDYYYNRYTFFTSYTGTGIRPAVKLRDLSDGTVVKTEYKPEPAVPDRVKKHGFFERTGAFFRNIFGIAGYYMKPAGKENTQAQAVIASVKRGINMPCMESGWARDYILEKETFETVRNKGFDFIRLPANLVCMLDSDGRLNESAMKNLDAVLHNALDTGLTVFLDLHGWEELNRDPSYENVETLISVWKQTAERYAGYPEELCFEILNEPNNSSGKMTGIRWNYIQNAAAAAIRKIDSDRIIVLSPGDYNSAYKAADTSFKHRDPYLIIDVHDYAPMEFTHQGAEWIPGVFEEKVSCTQETLDAFAEPAEKAAEFSRRKKIKVVVGEFGVYEKQAEKDDITKFLSSAVNCMEKNGLAWSYWEYNAGFGAYDYHKKEWKPFVTDALFQQPADKTE